MKISQLPILFVFVLLFTACAKKTTLPSRATLIPLARVTVTDKSSFPEAMQYAVSLYSDQRLEMNGVAGTDKIGAYTTMLSQKEMQEFQKLISVYKRGHFTYLEPTKKLWYDFIYYPLKKDISMNDAIQEGQTAKMIALTMKVEEFLNDKKWINKNDAPKLFLDVDDGTMLITLKEKVMPKDIAATEKYAPLKLKAIRQTDKRSNTWHVAFDKTLKTADAVYKVKSHPDVLGAIPNHLINITENLSVFQQKELIVQFKDKTDANDWVKQYSGLKALKQLSTENNTWLINADEAIMPSKEWIAKIKQDIKVTEVQSNKKVSLR